MVLRRAGPPREGGNHEGRLRWGGQGIGKCAGPDPLEERRITMVCCDEGGGPSARCGWVDAGPDPHMICRMLFGPVYISF